MIYKEREGAKESRLLDAALQRIMLNIQCLRLFERNATYHVINHLISCRYEDATRKHEMMKNNISTDRSEGWVMGTTYTTTQKALEWVSICY